MIKDFKDKKVVVTGAANGIVRHATPSTRKIHTTIPRRIRNLSPSTSRSWITGLRWYLRSKRYLKSLRMTGFSFSLMTSTTVCCVNRAFTRPI